MSEPESPAANPYAVTLDALEHDTKVPPDEQITEGSSESDGAAAWAWDEQRRQMQLAGGA